MTDRAGRFSQNFCGLRSSLRARRSYLTCRKACSRKGGLNIECLTTARNFGMAMNQRLESAAQPDGPVDIELMKRISEGDTLAFAKFYDRYSACSFLSPPKWSATCRKLKRYCRIPPGSCGNAHRSTIQRSESR